MREVHASRQTLRRLPVYLRYLTTIRGNTDNISATSIADAFGLNDVQVRKDLAAVSGSGRPKTGYKVEDLISQIKKYLSCDMETKTVIVGVGRLARALLPYGGFDAYGLNIIAAFDSDVSIVGETAEGRLVRHVDELTSFCRAEDVQLAILTVPADAAQNVCDRLVSAGIRAIWNFAPTILKAPEGIIIENENLASSLAVLSRRLHGINESGAML